MRFRWAALVCAFSAVVPIPASAAASCADIYLAMSLGPFPADAPASTLLFYAAETAGGSFTVRFTGLVCSEDQDTGITAEYSDSPGSAQEGLDYVIPEGQRTPMVCQSRCPSRASVSFPLMNDPDEEPVVERLTIELRNPSAGSLDPPSSAPFLIVDDDGAADRVGLDDLPYSSGETEGLLAVPVWRAGPAAGTVRVPYTVGSGSASPDTDFRVTSPNPLTFGPGDRVELVTLAIENDRADEEEETVELALGTPEGATLAAPGTKVVRILDASTSQGALQSRLHHPRQGRTYSADDFRVREIHVFTEGPGGAAVAKAHVALRSNLRGRGCAWLTGKRFRPGPCGNPRWIDLKSYEPDFFYVRLRPLRPSRGTIKSYTAFSRALDAGIVERSFAKGRNENTFEVKRPRRAGSR